jgi:hypothetical protein
MFEFLNDLRVMMGVDRLAHLGLVFSLGRINVRLHEVQQLRPITLAALRRLKQAKLMIGNDYSFPSKFQNQARLRRRTLDHKSSTRRLAFL